MDGTGLAWTNAEALLSAISEILADLAQTWIAMAGTAQTGIADDGLNDAAHATPPALEQLSAALGCSLRLVIADSAWQAGHLVARSAGQICQADARLEGVPEGLCGSVRQALAAVLRVMAAHHRARSRAAAQQSAPEGAESKIARRDQLLRQMLDLTPVGAVLIDEASGRIIEANTAFLRFGTWTPDALVGVSIRSLLRADQGENIFGTVADLNEGASFGPFDQHFVRPDGTGFPAISRGLVLRAGDGNRIIWLMVEDVSELRAHLAEVQSVRDEALRAQAELQTAVQALPHGFMLFDADDRIVLVNDHMMTLYPELAPVMMPGCTYVDLVRAGVAQGLWPVPEGQEAAYVDAVMSQRRAPVLDRLAELRDGRVIRVLDRRTPTGGRVGLRIDVTVERDYQRRLSQVIDGSQAGTWECDFLTWENRVNARWAEMLGWTCDSLAPITLMTWRDLLHPDDLEQAMAMVMRVGRGETDHFDVVFRLRHREGHWVWVQSRGTVSMRDSAGTPIRMSGVHVDVSALKAAEQRLEQIIEGAEAGTWHHDMRLGVCHVNALWVRMLGYTLEELCPITDEVWQGLLHPDDWTLLNRNMQARFARGIRQFQDELRLRHKDGHWVWVASRGQVTEWDALGRPTATTGVHLDISARKRLEGDLELERDFLSTLMETSGSGILAVDDSARIVFFNREVQRILELPGEVLLNQVCDPVALRLSDAEGQPLSMSGLPCQRVLASGQSVRDLRLRVAMADGREKVLSVNAALLPDPGMTARVVCTFTDVTATAKAECDLRAAIERAETANRAKSQFLANMSHELRTPLNGVLGMAELMADGGLDPAQGVMLAAIRESGAHLLSVVNDLLDLAKIESGKLALELAPVWVPDLAARIEAMHGLAAQRKGIALRVTLGPGSDSFRLGDAKRLLQVLHNLVGNAVKFTEAGTVDVMIVEDSASVDQLLLVVSDTGIGMSHDQTAMVFEEFTQADGSITRRFGGTGLGLPIVRRLVAQMEGEVSLVSAHGRGTAVTVTLPMPRVDTAQTGGGVVPGAPLEEMPFSGLRVLLAEDNPTNRLIMRAMLARLGALATLVCDGDEAVDVWRPGRFDLVLLDISMPRKDGLTALAEMIHKAGSAGLPPVVAVTANAMAQHLQEYRAAGFAEVVTKPVTLEALAGAIQRTRPEGAVTLPSPSAIPG